MLPSIGYQRPHAAADEEARDDIQLAPALGRGGRGGERREQ